MSDVTHARKKLLARTRRIQGQLAAVEKMLSTDGDCTAVLTQIAAVRGAVQALLLEVLSDHLHEHVASEADALVREKEASDVMSLLRRHIK